MVGNLATFPLYGVLEKMDAPFGQTGSVSPFTYTTMWHAFGELGYGARIGFKKGDFHAKLMAVQGGAKFRPMHTLVGNGTNVPSKVNNYAADPNYLINIVENVNLLLEASYLKGSAYCQDFSVTHFSACAENNPA